MWLFFFIAVSSIQADGSGEYYDDSYYYEDYEDPTTMDSDGDGLTDDAEYNGFEIFVSYWVEGYIDPDTGESYGHWETMSEWVYPDPYDADSDNDLLPDGWEINNGWNPMDSTDGLSDVDFDGLSMGEEYLLGTDWNLADSDDDGIDDGDEVANGTNPDDINDPASAGGGSTPPDPDQGSGGGGGGSGGDPPSDPDPNDSDADGLPNDWETANDLDPNNAADALKDYDYDRLSNLLEYQNGTSHDITWTFVEIPAATMNKLIALDEFGGVLGRSGDTFRYWKNGNVIDIDSTLATQAQYSNQPTAQMSNRGLVALVNQTSGDDELRIYQVEEANGVSNLLASFSYDLLLVTGVTDSGFVYGYFKEGGGDSQAFRWRNGIFENLGAPSGMTNLYITGGNERGELIANNSWLWRNGQWEAGGGGHAINDRGQVVFARTVAGSSAYFPNYTYHLSNPDGTEIQLPDLGNFKRLLFTDDGQVVTTGTYYNSSWDQAHYDSKQVDASGYLFSLDQAEPLNANRSWDYWNSGVGEGETYPFVVKAVNVYGEVGGYMHADEDDGAMDESQRTGWAASGEMMGSMMYGKAEKAVLWRDGKFVIDGFAYKSSRITAVTNSGHALIQGSEFQFNWDEFGGVTGGEVKHRGILVPNNDTDSDKLPDDWEAYHNLSDPTADSDNDGLTNLEEYVYFTDPNEADSDGDLMSDGWELANGHDALDDSDASIDLDGDQLSATQEYAAGTDPLLTDSDGDGEKDGDELANGKDPLDSTSFTDTDGDGLADAWEMAFFGDLVTSDGTGDVDGDGYLDRAEFDLGLDPTNAADGTVDLDGDGLSASAEYVAGTNPNNADSDGDGEGDASEIQNGSDPLDRGSFQDADLDGLPDAWEMTYFGDLTTSNGSEDTDNDGLTLIEEIFFGTDPNNADSDGDKITDGGEVEQGTDPNNNLDTPIAEWFSVKGDLEEGLVKERSRKVTIPAGQTRLIVVEASSEEYPYYTSGSSEFNDKLVWNIQPDQGQVITGSVDVNVMHSAWIDDNDIVATAVIAAPADIAVNVEMKLSATNVSDSLYPSTIKIGLLPVEITWEAIGANDNVEKNIDPFSKKENGSRVFPGKKKPNDPEALNTVNLKIDIGIPDQEIFVKAFDVDDPTPNDFDEFNGSAVIDPNDIDGKPTGSDNLADHFNTPKEGVFVTTGTRGATVTTDSNGEVTLEFKVGMQPGNNYRIAVALEQTDLTILQATDESEDGYISSDEGSAVGFKGVLSSLLTVWRKLTIEVDSMTEPPSKLLRAAPEHVTAVGAHWILGVPGSGQSTLQLSAKLPDKKNFYEGGEIISGSKRFKIISNTDNWVDPDVIVIDGLPSSAEQALFKDKSFDIVDDDDGYAVEVGISPLLPQDGNSASIIEGISHVYREAYIEVVDAIESSGNPDKTVPFKSHVALGYTPPSLNLHQKDEPDFWCFAVFFAYQADNKDRDPAGSNFAAFGVTIKNSWDLRTDGFTKIFIETIRDQVIPPIYNDAILARPESLKNEKKIFQNRLYSIIAHEIGHSPGRQTPDGDHNEMGLMDEEAYDLSVPFTPATIKRFREVKSWQN
ncbi:MAG: hypothetical protein L3J79_02265 [Candidatus Marinimicrobia bacterium]|nr:hypothetical protein [Candidatus Neomarinimicrobiota bacterium]